MGILCQCTKCGSEVEGLAVVESAVVKDLCTIPQLRVAFEGREDAGLRTFGGVGNLRFLTVGARRFSGDYPTHGRPRPTGRKVAEGTPVRVGPRTGPVAEPVGVPWSAKLVQ